MGRILADRQGVFLADRARLGLGWIGGAENIAVDFDGVLAFENLNHHRTGDHRFDEFAEERPGLVDGIKGFRLLAGHLHPLLRDDAQAGLLDQRVDRAGEVAARRVGLEDGEGVFDRHERRVPEVNWWDAALVATG